MASTYSHDTFLSPFTWRYGSDAMRSIWSEEHKRRLWRRIWVALAEAQMQAGLVSREQVEDLHLHQDQIDLERAHQIESEIRHDLMAEVRAYAEQCLVGGGIIHLGATSMDIEDNADALRLRESLRLLVMHMRPLLARLASLIEAEADSVCMAYTHLQPAEPTTIGYRLAVTAQDLLHDYHALQINLSAVRGKGFKGAVGTGAAYHELLTDKSLTPHQMETYIMQALDLPAYPITAQTYPRRQDWDILNALAGLALTIYRFAFDLRILQSPTFGEWSEPFAASQVGSSAMPFKRNPIHAENIDSLARYLAALPRIAWDNAAHSLLERTLDDSANRRLVLPEAFLAADELLQRMQHILNGLRLNRPAIQRNLETYGLFAATERLLMETVRAGADRQHMHEIIRQHSLAAWDQVQSGQPNSLVALLTADPEVTRWVSPTRLYELMDASAHIGDAPARARQMAAEIRNALNESA